MKHVGLNGLDAPALRETADALDSDSSLAAFTFRVRNHWAGGATTRSSINDYYGLCEERSRPEGMETVTDEPLALTGTETAPSAVEFLLHAVASSLTTTLVQIATMRGISLRLVETRIAGRIDQRQVFCPEDDSQAGFEGIDVTIAVAADSVGHDLDVLVAQARRRAPVLGVVAAGVPVTVRRELL